MVAIDRKVNPNIQINRIDIARIEKIIAGLIGIKNILCSYSHPSIIVWA
jgi:hypothetical protein